MSIHSSVALGLLLICSSVSAQVIPTTYDPASATGNLQLSNGNLTTTVNGGRGGARSVHSVTSGKYYWEATLLCPAGPNIDDTLGFSVGVVAPGVPLGWPEYFHYATSNWVWGFLTDGPDAHHANTFRRLFGVAGTMLHGDVVRLALDMDSGYLWLGRNGQWADGDPATGLDPTFAGLPGELYAAVMMGSRQCSSPPNYLTANTNFGPSFDYPVPAGFNAGFGLLGYRLETDIKPGKEPNSINPASGQKIPVAILTTEDFDASQVDPLSVVFGPDGASEVHGKGHIADVDLDGDLDLLMHFDVQETGISCGDTEATLTGQTFGGEPITGSDAIVTVNCPSFDGTTISVLIGDKDCFGLGGVCSEGDRYVEDLGGAYFADNRDAGEPLGVDHWGTRVGLAGPSFDIGLALGGATPSSALFTIFIAGLEHGATFYFNGSNIGTYAGIPINQINPAITLTFDVPISLLSDANILIMSVPDVGFVQDGFIIDHVELIVETQPAGN